MKCGPSDTGIVEHFFAGNVVTHTSFLQILEEAIISRVEYMWAHKKVLSLSRHGPMFTLSYRLAGRKVINETILLKVTMSGFWV